MPADAAPDDQPRRSVDQFTSDCVECAVLPPGTSESSDDCKTEGLQSYYRLTPSLGRMYTWRPRRPQTRGQGKNDKATTHDCSAGGSAGT